MDADIRALIGQIHAQPSKAALVLAGGGASVAGWLLAVPGGSRTVLEVAIPYSQQAFAEYLRHEPSSYCSPAVTHDLAVRARERAAHLAPGEPVAGIGCTASLRSDRPKRGDHRIHLAAASQAGTIVLSLTLAKEQRDREGEEDISCRMALNLLAEAFALPGRLPLPLLPGEAVQREEHPAGLLARFLSGESAALCVEPDGRLCPSRCREPSGTESSPPRLGGPTASRCREPSGTTILPGSFNPLHEGHCGMADVAARLVGRRVAFELSVANVEKPPLAEAEVRRRMAHFAWRAPLWLTHAPTFLEKSRLFPGAVFVVGIDTAVRIVDPRFYGGSVERMRTALQEIRAHGARFLVAGRLVGERFTELAQAEIPEEFRDLFMAIPCEMFRTDISSTQLRAAQK
jgi:hypothetical protein